MMAGGVMVLLLWACFLVDYPTTRDVYFTVAMLHVLAEAPFLLRMIYGYSPNTCHKVPQGGYPLLGGRRSSFRPAMLRQRLMGIASSPSIPTLPLTYAGAPR